MPVTKNKIETMLSMLMRESTPKYEAIAAGEKLLELLPRNSPNFPKVEQRLKELNWEGTVPDLRLGARQQVTEKSFIPMSSIEDKPPRRWVSWSDYAREFKLKPAFLKDYQKYLEARAKNGLKETHKYDYPFEQGMSFSWGPQIGESNPSNRCTDSRRIWCSDQPYLEVPSEIGQESLCGSYSVQIIMTHPKARASFLGWNHVNVYFLKDGGCLAARNDTTGWVPEYTDAKIPQKGNRDDQALEDFLYGRPAGK